MNARPRVLVREEIADAGVELLRSRFDVDVDTESDLASIIGLYDAIVIRSATKLTADVIGRADRHEGDRPRRRRRRQRRRRRGDHAAASSSRTRPSRTSSRPPSTPSACCVALARNIPQAHAALVEGGSGSARSGAGSSCPRRPPRRAGLRPHRQQVARRALGMQVRVIAYDPFVAADRFRELGVEQRDVRRGAREGRLRHRAPAAERPETRGAINAEAIAKMKDGVRIVKRARRPRRRDRARSRRCSRARSPAPPSTSSRRSPYSAPAAASTEHRRHAAPGRLDRRGAGSRRA